MHSVKRLLDPHVKYAALVGEFSRFSTSDVRKILKTHSSFLDWLVDPALNGLSSSKADELLHCVQSAIKDKIEIGLTAVGSIKIDEIEMRLMKVCHFVSVAFLQRMFANYPQFEIQKQRSSEYVSLTSCSTTLNKVSKAKDRIVASSTAGRGVVHEKQLAYLYKCQPNIIKALQPGVKMNDLFQAYYFWKSMCKFSSTYFITWLLDIAEYMHTKNLAHHMWVSYQQSLQEAFLRAGLHYVRSKARTISELVSLISQDRLRFVDAEFLLNVIKKNSKNFELKETTASPLQSSYIVNVRGNECTVASVGEECLLSVTTTCGEKHGAVEKVDENVKPNCSALPDNIWSQCAPLIANVASWFRICKCFTKLSKESDLVARLVDEFGCCLSFLVNIADRFKPKINIELYELNLMKHVKKQVCSEMVNFAKDFPSRPVTIKILLELLNKSKCCIIDAHFLMKTLMQFPRDFELNKEDIILLNKEGIILDSAGKGLLGESVNTIEQNNYTSLSPQTSINLDKLKAIPELKHFVSREVCFLQFMEAYQVLQAPAKLLLEETSHSFYSLLLSVACSYFNETAETFRLNLNNVIVAEIENVFHSCNVSCLELSYLQCKVTRGFLNLIQCADLRYVIENSSDSAKFTIDSSLVHLTKELPASNSAQSSTSSNRIVEDDHHSNFDPSINIFVTDICRVLTLSSPPSTRLHEIYYHLRELPGSFMAFILEKYGTLFQFMIDVIPNIEDFYNILREEVLHNIGSNTVSCEELRKKVFDVVPFFVNTQHFIDFLQRNQDYFVVSHQLMGDTLTAVRRTGPNGQPMFYNGFEAWTFRLFNECLPKQTTKILFFKLFRTIWHSPSFTSIQRDFIFGSKPLNRPFEFYEIQFKRYLLMHPAVFTIDGDNVYYSLSQERERKCSSSTDLNASVVASEESEIVQEDNVSQATHKSSKRKRKHHKRHSSKEHTKHKSKKHRHKKGENCSLDNPESIDTEHITNYSEDSSKLTAIDSLPDELIQDVAIGKIVSSGLTQMKILTLVESLTTSLFSQEQKELFYKDPLLKSYFLSKVTKALSQGSQFELCDKSESGDFILVRLAQKSTYAEENPVVFKWMSRLTGVTTSNLQSYVAKVLEISGRPINTNILFTKVHQRFRDGKASNATPNDVIQCQTIACLKKNPMFFIDFVSATCCLKRDVCGKTSSDLKMVTDGLSDQEMNSFISEFFEEKSRCMGVSVDDLAQEVHSYFKTKFEKLGFSSVKLVVQGLIADNEKIGFTPTGKVAPQKNVSKDNEETHVEMSDNELEMDISDEEFPMLPDSTNQKSEFRVDIDSQDSADEMYNKYIEADVIRCDFDASSKAKLSPAAASAVVSTTVGAGSPVARPSNRTPIGDPRLHGKVMQNVTSDPFYKPPTANVAPDSRLADVEKPVESRQSTSLCNKTDEKAASRNISRAERNKLLHEFAAEYLEKSGYSARTQTLIEDAYKHFKGGYFTRSVLAFEAYVRDFIALSNNDFSFANDVGNLGVTWVFYRPSRLGNVFYSRRVSLPFAEMLNEVADASHTYLSAKPFYKDTLDAVCNFITIRFSDKLSILHPKEVLPVCRNLVLVSFIRNLHRFVFAKSDSSVYARKDSVRPSVSSKDSQSSTNIDTLRTSTANIQESALTPKAPTKSTLAIVSALKLIASILRKHGPCTKTHLREIWTNEAEISLRKVLGTGVSFTLSMRKFESYFPTSSDGRISINENAFGCFLAKNT